MVLILDPLAQGEPRCPRCGRAALCGGVWQGGPGDVLVAVGEAPRAVVVGARG